MRIHATIAALGIVAGCGKTPVDTPVVWTEDADAGFAAARAQHKGVLVYVGAEWDASAKELEHITFADPEVRALLGAGFIAIHVDLTDDERNDVKAAIVRFKIVGEPLLILYNRDGVEVTRINEFVPPRALVPRLRSAVASPWR